MRLSKLLFSAFAMVALSFAACGGGDDGGGNAPDANINTPPDANVVTPPDAAASINPWGEVCSADGTTTPCPNADETCASLGGTNGTCSSSCGTTADTSAAPVGGDDLCAASYTGTTGTPMCALYDSSTNPITWYCAIICGTSGSTDFGTCPNGLTCTQNLCQ